MNNALLIPNTEPTNSRTLGWVTALKPLLFTAVSLVAGTIACLTLC